MTARRLPLALVALPLLAACSTSEATPGQVATTTVVVQSPSATATATATDTAPDTPSRPTGTSAADGSSAGTTTATSAAGSGSGRSGTATPTSTAGGRRVADATLADLRRAQVPADCEMPALRLVDGRTPESLRPRQGELSESARPILADVDGDGAKEAIGSYWCSAGGVSWPERLLVVKSGGDLLTSYSLARDAEHSVLRELYRDGQGVHLTFDTTEGASGNPTRYTGLLTVDGTRARLAGETKAAIRVSEVQVADFLSPGGTLACHMDADGARCDVAGPRYQAPPKPAGCEGDWGQSVFATTSHAGAFTCVTDSAYGGAEQAPSWWVEGKDATLPLGGGTGYALGYGHVLRSGTTSCEVLPSAGAFCQTLDHGFRLAKDSYRLW